MGASISSAAAIVAEQRALWGTAPRDWAELAEAENQPLYELVLDAAMVAGPTRLLDVGCGSGLLCQMAAARGAFVSGVDVTPELLAIAVERTPSGDFRDADMSALAFVNESFDAVTGVNAFQFAPDVTEAFAEAARVLRPGGRFVAAAFAEPERNEGTVLHLTMKALVVQAEGEEDGYAPYALSAEEGLKAAVTQAGMIRLHTAEVPIVWRYANTDAALRALLASAGGARAIRAAGRQRVSAALAEPIDQFKGEDGVVRIHNLFRYVAAEKPQ